jgi:hypothetical protein
MEESKSKKLKKILEFIHEAEKMKKELEKK